MSMNQTFATWWVTDDREIDPCALFNWYVPYDGYDFDSLNESTFRGNVACMLKALSDKDDDHEIIIDGKADWVAYERGWPALVAAGEIPTYVGPFPAAQALFAVTANVKTPVEDSCPYGYYGGGYGYGEPGCGDALIIDLQKKPCTGGAWTSVLGTKIYIDAGKHCSGESALQATIVDTEILATDLMRFVVLQTGLNASHLTVTMFCGTEPACSGDEAVPGITEADVPYNNMAHVNAPIILGERDPNNLMPAYQHISDTPLILTGWLSTQGYGGMTFTVHATGIALGVTPAITADGLQLIPSLINVCVQKSERVWVTITGGVPAGLPIPNPGFILNIEAWERDKWATLVDMYRARVSGFGPAITLDGLSVNHTHILSRPPAGETGAFQFRAWYSDGLVRLTVVGLQWILLVGETWVADGLGGFALGGGTELKGAIGDGAPPASPVGTYSTDDGLRTAIVTAF